MNAADAIAFAALMIGLVSIFGVVSDMYRRRLAFRERELELMSRAAAEKAAQYAAQTERLEQRVRVLERIATDGNSGLAGEIEALRSEPAVAAAAADLPRLAN